MPIPEDIILKHGKHDTREQGMCVTEAVAYVAGEPHSDNPVCVSPVIGALLRSWNDALCSDADRTRLLMPLIPVVIGTRADKATEERRSYMALDWLIRVNLPAFLDLTPALQPHAAIIRALPEIADLPSAQCADPNVIAAWDAASDAASAAAWDAASVAAWDAARDAASAAASAAASVAAWTAACDAALEAAWAAALDADRETLTHVVSQLQHSAQDLVRRMAAVKETHDA